MKLKEIEQKISAKTNCGAKHVIVDYSKSIIKAVLHEFSGESLYQYLDRAYRAIHGESKTNDFSGTFIQVCAYYFLQMGRRKIKEFLKIARTTLKFTLFHEFLGGLYATLIWNKLDVL